MVTTCFPTEGPVTFAATGEWGTASVLVTSLSLALSRILGLTWPAYSVFHSSHDFATLSPNFLRLSAFPQAATGTPALLPRTSYTTVGIRVRSHTIQNPALSARPSPCGPKGGASGFICAWLSFAPPSQN